MQNVKSTMIDALLSHIAPHLCSGCSEIGTLLCDNCKYDISADYFDGCMACGNSTGRSGICKRCVLPYSRAWLVGERSGELRKLIDIYKFENARGAYIPLAELISGRLGQLPPNTVIVPIPTVGSHMRQRGFDHMLLIARRVAELQGIKMEQPLLRHSTTQQRGESRHTRRKQAATAFRIRGQVDEKVTYMLIDDIVTTGSTLYFAATALREAGASDVWAAAIARQPLD